MATGEVPSIPLTQAAAAEADEILQHQSISERLGFDDLEELPKAEMHALLRKLRHQAAQERQSTQQQLSAIQELTFLVQKLRLQGSKQALSDGVLKNLTSLACKYGVTVEDLKAGKVPFAKRRQRRPPVAITPQSKPKQPSNAQLTAQPKAKFQSNLQSKPKQAANAQGTAQRTAHQRAGAGTPLRGVAKEVMASSRRTTRSKAPRRPPTSTQQRKRRGRGMPSSKTSLQNNIIAMDLRPAWQSTGTRAMGRMNKGTIGYMSTSSVASRLVGY